MPFTRVELYTISMLIGAKLEPAYYAQYTPLEENFIGQAISYQYLEALVEEIAEAF